MNYFTSDLWTKINSSDEQERNLAEKQWSENSEKYNKYFSEIVKTLPKKFIKIYLKQHGFHDYIINSINIITEGKKSGTILSIIIKIENSKNSFCITYNDVKRYHINVPNVSNWIFGEMSWGYSEFELLQTGIFIQKILCDIDSEIENEFKKIIIEKK